MTSSSSPPNDTHLGVVINCAKCDILRAVFSKDLKRTYVHTRIYMSAFYMRYEVDMTLATPQDNYPVVVINCAQFDICTPRSF